MRQITILDASPSDGGRVNVRSVFWLPVPSGFEVPRPNAQSVIPTAATLPGGVTPDDVAALQKGVVVEEVRGETFPTTYSAEQVKDFLVAEYQARSDFFASIPFKGQLFGVAYVDGSWTK